MAIDKHAILESAQLYTSKGQFDKAIAEWKKLITGTPVDATIHNTIGDLHLKRNAPTEAIEAFFQAAAAFRAGAAALKAIALYKKILKVDPTRADAYRCMGDLNAERGLAGNAVTDYLVLAKMLLKAGKQEGALDVYRKIAALDPTNAEALQRLGGAADAGGRGSGPTSQAQVPVSGEPRTGEGQGAGTSSVGPTSEPTAPVVAYKLPADYSRQGFLSEAIKLTATDRFVEADMVLMEMLSREPGDPEVCRLLATLHLKQGQLACAGAEFQFLAEAAMRAHDYVLAESMLLEYLKADPSCVSLCELLGRLYEQNGDAPAAAVQYGKALETLIAAPDPELATLPFELYEKLLGLAPSSPLVSRYAALFPAAIPSQPIGDTAVSVTQEQAAAVQEPAEPPQEVQPGMLAFRFSESAPDAARQEEAKETEERGHRESTPAKMVFRFAGQAGEPAVSAVPEEAAAEPAQVPAGPDPGAERSVPAAVEPDYAEQYQLGLAYQRMGLPELATEALLVAINGADYFADSCRLLALCCKEQGRVQEAITYLERGLSGARPLADEAATLLRYELGLLYETGGRVEQALQVFSAVPTFRDVRERVARLSDVRAGDQAGPGSAQDALTDATPVAVGHPSAAAGEASGLQKKKRRISYL